MSLYLAAWSIVIASYLEFLECHLHKLQSPECSCTPYILGEQILSYHTSAQIITLAACKISHSF